jgi:hypothetical protein
MTERHLSFTAVREVFNEYQVENGFLYLRIKPVLTDIISEITESKRGLRFRFKYVSEVIRLSDRNIFELGLTSSAGLSEKQLEFIPVKEIINIYETEDEDIVLVVYVLDKLFTKNQLDNEGNPILGFTERNFVDVVPRPDRTRTD